MLLKCFSLFFVSISAFPFPDECGINYIEPDNVDGTYRGTSNGSIVGGYDAVPGAWPWQAYLLWEGSFFCGGTLIADQWILTAGHCCYDGLDPGPYTVVLGEYDDRVVEGHETYVPVEKVIVHPEFDEVEIVNDFTLLKLAEKVQFNDWVAPACFPKAHDDLESTFPPGQMCITTGWGTMDIAGSKHSNKLKQEYAQLWSNEECDGADAYDGWITDDMICAGFHLTGNEDEEKCGSLGYGDSGGPLVCRDAEGRWTHLGATSWGTDCYPNYYTPGVFANTINLRHWIVQTLNDN